MVHAVDLEIRWPAESSHTHKLSRMENNQGTFLSLAFLENEADFYSAL